MERKSLKIIEGEGGGERGEDNCSLPLPSPKKLSGMGVLLCQMQLTSKKLNIEFQNKSKILSASSTEFRKKQDPLKIVLSCKVANFKDILLKTFFSKLAERYTNKKKMKIKKYRKYCKTN